MGTLRFSHDLMFRWLSVFCIAGVLSSVSAATPPSPALLSPVATPIGSPPDVGPAVFAPRPEKHFHAHKRIKAHAGEAAPVIPVSRAQGQVTVVKSHAQKRVMIQKEVAQ
jgi:hypothetical protein